MAEIRKHQTGSGRSAIAQQVEAALGAAVRPVTPGAPPRPRQPRPEPGSPAASPTATSLPLGWTSPTPPPHRD